MVLIASAFLACSCSKKSQNQAPTAFDANTIKGDTIEHAAAEPEALPEARELASAQEAMVEILRHRPKVLGFGEFHQLESSLPVQSALSRFTEELFPVLSKHTAHLILETWSVDPRCGKPAAQVEKNMRKDLERPEHTESELDRLLRLAVESKVGAHVLEFSCGEYQALLDPTSKSVDYEKLLGAVTHKLGEQARLGFERVRAGEQMVVLYGGSTHNDLHPYPGLESWSYAAGISTISEDRFVEVDLYVPELVAGNELLSQEPWYPLLERASPDKVLFIERSPRSYILILQKGREARPTARAAER